MSQKYPTISLTKYDRKIHKNRLKITQIALKLETLKKQASWWPSIPENAKFIKVTSPALCSKWFFEWYNYTGDVVTIPYGAEYSVPKPVTEAETTLNHKCCQLYQLGTLWIMLFRISHNSILNIQRRTMAYKHLWIICQAEWLKPRGSERKVLQHLRKHKNLW